MKRLTRKDLLKMWMDFYKSKGHIEIKSASVIPENDPSVLFTTAGMHPLVPYLMGQPHPMGKRICDVQKCVRTGDIDEVGDRSHLTFFEMLGSWSIGDYFKKEKTAWSHEFITSPKYLGLKPEQFAVTCFSGNEHAPKDTETAGYWEALGVSKDRIFFIPDNWWEINRGPCGPDNEFFLDTGKPKCSDECNPSCDCGKYMEFGNDVYMQYNKVSDTEYLPATQKNVDCGYGLERCIVVLNGAKSIYVTDVFEDAIKLLEKLSGKKYNDDGDEYTRSFRIVCDHIRTATVIMGDEKGLAPSNVGAGYVLRRLIRRAVREAMKLGIEKGKLALLAEHYIEFFEDTYPEFRTNENKIISELNKEEERFLNTVNAGVKEFEKVVNGILRKNEFMSAKDPKYVPETIISGKSAFRLFDTFGFPVELTIEMAKEHGLSVDKAGFDEAFKEHQELARTASAGQFKGGLADGSDDTIKLHTACHLMLAGLRHMFGTGVEQKGSNITSERLRFDFNFDRKLDPNEIKQLEDFVNDAIAKKIDVERVEMPFEEALKQGAYGVHKAEPNEIVSIYKIGDVDFQICGGPHVKNTGELGKFKINKEESSSAGVRRIKAVLE